MNERIFRYIGEGVNLTPEEEKRERDREEKEGKSSEKTQDGADQYYIGEGVGAPELKWNKPTDTETL